MISALTLQLVTEENLNVSEFITWFEFEFEFEFECGCEFEFEYEFGFESHLFEVAIHTFCGNLADLRPIGSKIATACDCLSQQQGTSKTKHCAQSHWPRKLCWFHKGLHIEIWLWIAAANLLLLAKYLSGVKQTCQSQHLPHCHLESLLLGPICQMRPPGSHYIKQHAFDYHNALTFSTNDFYVSSRNWLLV